MGGKYASLFFLSRFQAELDRLFQEIGDLGEDPLALTEWQPAIDVIETPQAILIQVELPGFSAADLKVEVRGTLVALSGTKAMTTPGAATARFHRMERSHGRFLREIQLPRPVNTHQGTAVLADGLLTMEFPKIQDKRQSARTLHVTEHTPEKSGAR
ncbi:MAG TPA: Hsp20/alpha crystallin family protein [Thermoanaerobaculia bacterium]